MDESSLNPPLDEYRRQFEILVDDARTVAADLTRPQINWAPTPKSWSIAQCLAHLNETDRAYADTLETGIGQARERGLVGVAPLRYGFFERWFIRNLEPPPKRRFSAPKKIVPVADHDPTEVVDTFAGIHERLDGLLERANEIDLSRAKVASPLNRLLKLRVGAVFAILAAHDRRHLWQARKVRNHSDFPAT